MYDVIVVGAGPAGILTGYHLKRNDLKYIILEKDRVGNSWRNMRAGMLLLSPAVPSSDWTSLTFNHPIWDISGVQKPFPTKDDFLCYLEKFVLDNKLNVKTKAPVSLIEKVKGGFMVSSDGEQYFSSYVIIATGGYTVPRYPDIPGLKDSSFVIHSSDFFNCMTYQEKKVLVVGSGNSAAEIAIDLSGVAEVTLLSRERLKYFTETNDLVHIRGLSESVLKELIQFGIIEYISNEGVASVEGGLVKFESGGSKEFHSIIAATGFGPSLPPLQGIYLESDDKGIPLINDLGESVSAEGVFFSGSLALFNNRCRFIHGFRNEVEKVTWAIFDRL